jgi:hypothetical protein
MEYAFGLAIPYSSPIPFLAIIFSASIVSSMNVKFLFCVPGFVTCTLFIHMMSIKNFATTVAYSPSEFSLPP